MILEKNQPKVTDVLSGFLLKIIQVVSTYK